MNKSKTKAAAISAVAAALLVAFLIYRNRELGHDKLSEGKVVSVAVASGVAAVRPSVQEVRSSAAKEPKVYTLAQPIGSAPFRPAENVSNVVSLASKAGFDADELLVIKAQYSLFEKDIALIEASLATVQATGANRWFVHVPTYHEEGEKAVSRFLNLVAAELPGEKSETFAKLLSNSPYIGNIGLYTQDFDIANDNGLLTVDRTEKSPQYPGYGTSHNTFYTNAVPAQFEALVSLIPELSPKS